MHHSDITKCTFYQTRKWRAGMRGITFQVAAFRLKYANIRVNQLYISFSVSCFSGDSSIAWKKAHTHTHNADKHNLFSISFTDIGLNKGNC